MTEPSDLVEINPQLAATVPVAANVVAGIPIPPVKVLQVLSAEDWEQFIEEWLTYFKTNGTYSSIKRTSGSGDLGLDIVAFTSINGFSEPWDSFQAKHYDHALYPSDLYPEIGKIVFHTFKKTPPFNQSCRTPRRHVFVAPYGVGIAASRLLKDPIRLREEIRSKWDSHCRPVIGTGPHTALVGSLLSYFDAFDFAIFDERTSVELIEDHSKTVFYAPRFGGGFPTREDPVEPPDVPAESESLYLRKLLDAYGDSLGKAIKVLEDLVAFPDLVTHYRRQRVRFYCAESLRNFARDRTPPRTFDSLQDDVYNGVIDVCDADYSDGLVRLRMTMTAAAQTNISGNALSSVTKVADKQGICHQLANDDRLTWKKI